MTVKSRTIDQMGIYQSYPYLQERLAESLPNRSNVQYLTAFKALPVKAKQSYTADPKASVLQQA